MTSESTKIVLKLDLKYLTYKEIDWLHALRNRVEAKKIKDEVEAMREKNK